MGTNQENGKRQASKVPSEVEAFISRWQGREGGQERANYAMFLTELCAAVAMPPPDPAGDRTEVNDYVFERVVKETGRDGSISSRRIDLYKRDSFVLEAKQSRQQDGGDKQVQGHPDLPGAATQARGRRGAARGWDVLMLNARRQAEDYVRLLPAGHEPPPFVIICDVGHCFEIYANFRKDGKAYDQFPDRRSFRIFLEDLRDAETRSVLAAIWSDPLSLDPARRSARVTREIAERLAKVSKALEEQNLPAEDVAMFLMRCLFTMFAEDVGLLPENAFKDLLTQCVERPEAFPHDVGQLWEAMDVGAWAHALRQKVRRFNGEFFRNKTAFPLAKREISELLAAARYNWREVDPSIFGALLEQALNPAERRKLGAHYTPRAYVERLVSATVIDPLREDWGAVVSTAERQKTEGRARDALATVRAYHDKLCATRVLDPACGTGNFLYVSLEMLKRLEGEVLEALADLGGQEALTGLEGHGVDPHQFLGLEVNPRAAAIAELVLWIGHLQWHLRTKGGLPDDPVLRAFRNIVVKDAVLEADKELQRDASGRPVMRRGADGETVEVYGYRNPRRPKWPEAEFIVGNPPFISNREMRQLLGDDYVDCLKPVYSDYTQAADFVTIFWIVAASAPSVRRVGLVSTSRLRMKQNNEVFRNALNGWNIIYAVPDHSWPANADAAVRVCFVVLSKEARRATLTFAPDHDVIAGRANRTDDYVTIIVDRISPDLTADFDITSLHDLISNRGLAHAGVKPYARNLLVDRPTRVLLFENPGDAERYCPAIYNGHDVGQGWRGYFVLDLNQLSEDQLRVRLRKVYQYVLEHVKTERQKERNKRLVQFYWKFEANRDEMRQALVRLGTYIATLENSPQRYFTTISNSILPDQKLRVIASANPLILGVLASHIHQVFSIRVGGRAGKANTPVYNTKCFASFPFPPLDTHWEYQISDLALEIDRHRRRALAEHPHLSMTGLYNVLERLRAGTSSDALNNAERRIFDDGLVLILKELHDKLDVAVANAYGWPSDLTDEDILMRLVALNKERAQEEARGVVRWLRPDYQIPRFGSAKERAELDLVGGGMASETPAAAGTRPSFPSADFAQTAAVMAALASASGPLGARDIAALFKGKKIVPKIASVLAALSRTGFVTTPDGGVTFAFRRAA